MVIVFTGNGKGKTTAALGLALRALGQGLKVIMIQFLKSTRAYGEIKAAPGLVPGLEIIQVGKDCVLPEGSERYQCETCDFACHIDPANPTQEDKASAREGVKKATEVIKSGQYDMVILDEINYAVDYGLVTLEEVLKLIEEKPAALHLVLTGRQARPELVRRADLVTEMLEIKHPYQKGLKSLKGIDL